jgi:hypothetical protein
VSGQVNLSDADKPSDSRFFGKPLQTKQIIAEIQEMVGMGALKIAPLVKSSAAETELTAENGSLRLLLAQAAIDAKELLAQAGIDAKER